MKGSLESPELALSAYDVREIFPGFGDTVAANIEGQCYTITEKAENWPNLIPGTIQKTFSFGDKTLVQDLGADICFLIDPAKSQPEILIAPSDTPLPAALSSYGPARWQIDKVAFQKMWGRPLGLHGDAFFALIQYQTTPAHHELVWLDRTHATAVHIPLQFNMDSSTQTLFKNLKGWPPESASNLDPDLDHFGVRMVTTDAGICLWTPSSGVWFIPYADIEAYLKSAEK